MPRWAVELAIATGGAVLGGALSWAVLRARKGVHDIASSQGLAARLTQAGITKFHISRKDYEGTLPQYLSRAKHSIAMVSVSLKLTDDSGDLVAFFRQRLMASPDFRVEISLLDPDCSGIGPMAEALDLAVADLKQEIHAMLTKLGALKESLPQLDKERLKVLKHEAIPMGSGILLDASPNAGTIQVETKVYRATRGDSFGYELRAGTSFYERHYRAYRHILDRSQSAVPRS